MPFDQAALLAPVTEAEPCGPPLNEAPAYDTFKAFANAPERPNWAKYTDQALKLAQGSRDLRAWVWLTRASICTEGVIGLAAGLRLIADGLEQYWDVLPPQHANENDPAERFMMRLSALTQLGATHFTCNMDDLRRFGRSFTDLQADLAEMVAHVQPDQATISAAGTARNAAHRICDIFARGFGPDRDPLVNFDTINTKLDAVEAKCASSKINSVPAGGMPVVAPSPGGQFGVVNSRQDVMRALDLVLDFYRDNEPSSPVPLLVARAKRLVPLSFVDAIKDLAPSGLKDLQIIAGTVEERK